MGMNYYALTNAECNHEGYEDVEMCYSCFDTGKKAIHIGKSSMGWQFSFQAHKGINSFRDWLSYIKNNHSPIFNEEGEKIKLLDFIKMVTFKQNKEGNLSHIDYCKERNEVYDCFKDNEGYNFINNEFS